MWPSRPDMSRDECRKCLRCLELDAYGNMVSVLRAQGPFTEEKQKLLSELAKVLHISNERHRAEIRRAVNDEKLSIIAEQLNGPNTCTDWAIEGRRTIPLLPRLKAHTAFTGLANSLSMVIAAANEKKVPVPSRVEETLVKAEAETEVLAESDEKQVEKLSALHSETIARGKKRKKSLRESPDSDKCRSAQLTQSLVYESETNPTPCKERKLMSPLPISSNQCPMLLEVSTLTSNSRTDSPEHTDTGSESSLTQLTCPTTTNASSCQESSTSPVTVTNSSEKNTCAVQNSTNSHASAPAATDSQDIIPNTVATCPSSAKSRINVTADQTNTNSTVQEPITRQCTKAKSLQSEDNQSMKECDKLVVAKVIATTDCETKTSRPDSSLASTIGLKKITTAKLCLTTKPIITNTPSRVVTVNSGSTASSGPGPPVATAPTTLAYKKLTPGKLNNHPGTKMGITLNSNKTLKINAHPNARLATKANVIVVQKGSSRGVTLSHGGKEVLGKVIMGGKNLCLAGQKSGNSVALMQHRPVSSNGDQTLAMLSTVNSNHTESFKSNAKTGNMIVFDIRQDVLEKNKILSQFLEVSGVFNPESKAAAIVSSDNARLATKNQSEESVTTPAKTVKSGAESNNSTEESDEKSKSVNESCLYSNDDAVKPSDAISEPDQGILTDASKRNNSHVVLDAQTGLYNFDSTDGTIIEDHVEETISTSGFDIFSTSLSPADINLENFRYMDNEEETMDERDETLAGSPMSTVEQLNKFSDT